jgi:hypothetical protein
MYRESLAGKIALLTQSMPDDGGWSARVEVLADDSNDEVEQYEFRVLENLTANSPYVIGQIGSIAQRRDSPHFVPGMWTLTKEGAARPN